MPAQETLKFLPVSTSTFRKIIHGGYLYVDKTKWIYKLIREPYGVYFLARPRRFGKSLLISTLDEIFQGNRELFKDLWLYDSPYQWEEHPVIRIDFSQDKVTNASELVQSIHWNLRLLARQHHVTLMGETYTQQFRDLIFQLSAQAQVAILIDEYDKPILDNIENIEQAQRIREVLKGFYGVIKAMDAHIRFVLLTGVSKFSQVGVFSDLNNLQDLTLDRCYTALLGITQAELERDFYPYLQAFADQQGDSLATLLAQFQFWYNGFCFSDACQLVYNPFSLLKALKARKFSSYWFETGTPTFLLKLIKTRGYDVRELEQLDIPAMAFSTYEIERLDIVPLLFQTGYLTIKAYNPKNRRYRLSYPNYEMEHAFLTHLFDMFGQLGKAVAVHYLGQLAAALQEKHWPQFFLVLNTLLANIPYDIQIKQETYYQSIFHLIFKLVGLEINAEVRTNRGRIDATLELESDIFIFEFKLDGSAAEALAQIKEKEYFARYQLAGKTLHLVGVNFEMEKRGVGEWRKEVIRDS